MNDVKKVLPPSQHSQRALLIPQKTTIQFDYGIQTTTSDAKSKPTSAYHRNASRQRPVENNGSKITSRLGTAETHDSDTHTAATAADNDNEDFLSSSNVEIFLSDAILDAFFTQGSPSTGSISVTPLNQAEVNHISKMRVVEEMSRIHQRAHVTEQQRQQYMQTALAMDAPRLARMILQDEVEHNAAVMPAPHQQSAGSDQTVNKSASAVSFLTAGELFLSDEHKGTESPSFSAPITARTSDTPDDSAGVGAPPARSHSFRRRQSEDDEKFCKAVEEVERIRKRFIQKASLPLLGSRSNVDQLSSASLDITGSGGSGGSSTSTSAKVRKNGIFGSRTSFNAGDLMSAASAVVGGGTAALGRLTSRGRDKSDLRINTEEKPSRNNSADDNDRAGYPVLSPDKGTSPLKYLQQLKQGGVSFKSAGVAGAGANASAGYNIDTSDYSDEHYRLHPDPLSPNTRNTAIVNNNNTKKEGSSLSPVPLERKKSFSRQSSFSTVPAPAPAAAPSVQSTNLNNLNSTMYSTDTFESDTATKSGAANGLNRQSSAGNVKASLDVADVNNTTLSRQQALVASSIDMLIGSRYNSDRELDSPCDAPQEILGSSLVLLQQQLDSAATAATDASPNNSYRNVYSSKAVTNTNSTRVSAAAATALATLRPSSASRRVNASVPQAGGMQFETQYNTHNYFHDPHLKLHPLEISDHHHVHSNVHNHGQGQGSGQGMSMNEHDLSHLHGELHTDDSTSSLGSNMFAFKVGSGSTHEMSDPWSAERPNSKNKSHRYDAQEPQVSREFGTASFTSSLALSENTSPEQQLQRGAGGYGAGAGGGVGSPPLQESRRNLFPIPDSAHAGHHAAQEDHGATLRTLRSTGSGVSSLSFTDSIFHSSGDTIASLTATQQPHLAPLNLQPRFQQAEPSVVTAPMPAETPLQLSARRLSSAEKAATKPGSRNAPVRLSAFELDVSNINNPVSAKSGAPTLSNVSSTRNTSTKNSTLNGSKIKAGAQGASAVGPTSTRAAKLRQNAQLLLTSPLSEWMTAGAQMHQQQLSTSTSSGPASQSTPLVDQANTTVENGEPQKHRRNSKFTFEELQAADLQLGAHEQDQSPGQGHRQGLGHEHGREKDSPTKTISPVKPAANSSKHRRQGSNTTTGSTATTGNQNEQVMNGTRGKGEARKGESLPQLPGLGHNTSAESLVRNSLYAYSSSADPAVVQNVYRSLNVLNGHIAQMTPSLSASITASAAGSTASAGASGPGSSTVGANHSGLPNSRVASIDQELDDLLTGSSERVLGVADPGGMGGSADSGDGTPGSGTGSARADRDDTASRQQHFKKALRPSRQNVLISQSCIEQSGGLSSHQLRSSDGGHTEGHHPSSLAMAGSAALLNMHASTNGEADSAGSAGSGAVPSGNGQAQQLRATESKLRLLRPANSTSALPAHTSGSEQSDDSSSGTGTARAGRNAIVSPTKQSSPTKLPTRPPLSGNGSGNNSGGAINALNGSYVRDTTPINQMQRLGALAAALDAGDAVGKLMAQMMLGGNGASAYSNVHSGSNSGFSSGQGNSINNHNNKV